MPARPHRRGGAVPGAGAANVAAMSRRDRLVLRAFSLWSLFVWGVLIRNMVRDRTHGLGFRLVHIGLAAVSLGFAAATWLIAGRQVAGRGREAGGQGGQEAGGQEAGGQEAGGQEAGPRGLVGTSS
jgi:hypothetical protein